MQSVKELYTLEYRFPSLRTLLTETARTMSRVQHSIKDFRLTSYPKLVCYHPMCLALVRPHSLVSNEYYTQPRDFHVDLRLPVGYAER